MLRTPVALALIVAAQVSLFPATGPTSSLDGTLMFTPVCGGLNDTAEFTSLIASIGARAGALVLPVGRQCAVDSLTIPANITLESSGGSGLKIRDAEVVTVLGAVDADATRQLFFNIDEGQGSVSFEGNQKIEAVVPQWFGAKGDGVTLDVAACRAALAALPSPGHLHLPAGTYWLGSAAASARLTVLKDQITITGDGIQRTILKYDSDVGNIDGSFGPGSALRIGETGGTPHFGYVLQDFTIEDVGRRTRWTGGHNPSGVDAYRVDRVRIERVEAINIKGNSAFLVFSPSKDGRDLVFRHNIVRGNAQGGYVQGAGLNFASFSNAIIDNNHIEGVGLGGIGAGACGACKNIRITNNVIDYLDRAAPPASLIQTGDGDGIWVSGNTIRRFAGGQTAIAINSEDGGHDYPIRNVVISNNVIDRNSDLGIALAGNWQNVVIRDNQIRARYPIDFQGGRHFESLEISGNVFDTLELGAPAVSKVPPAAGGTVSVRNNVVTGSADALRLVDYQQFPAWRLPNIRMEGNRLAGTVRQTRNSQIDGLAYQNVGPGGEVITADRPGPGVKVRMFGARPGDHVEVTLDAGFPDGVTGQGTVTAADEVTMRLTTDSASETQLPSWPNNFVTVRVTPRQ